MKQGLLVGKATARRRWLSESGAGGEEGFGRLQCRANQLCMRLIVALYTGFVRHVRRR